MHGEYGADGEAGEDDEGGGLPADLVGLAEDFGLFEGPLETFADGLGGEETEAAEPFDGLRDALHEGLEEGGLGRLCCGGRHSQSFIVQVERQCGSDAIWANGAGQGGGEGSGDGIRSR